MKYCLLWLSYCSVGCRSAVLLGLLCVMCCLTKLRHYAVDCSFVAADSAEIVLAS